MTPDDFYGEIVRKARERAHVGARTRQAGAQTARERGLAEARQRAWEASQAGLVAAERARAELREQALAAFWPDDGLEDD